MTSEQKKAIDACKDQAAQEIQYESWDDMVKRTSKKMIASRAHRAMQLYGEQCRKEGAEKAISAISDAVADLDKMAPAYKNVAGVHDFLKDSFDKLTAPGR